ncbi:MAG TPA: hypothetical protein VM756_03570, partial [Burkholderiales bacterium]|nr:hypothetical protein [Burkholderiales bacterium]
MTTGNLTIQDNDTVDQYTSVGEAVFGFNFPVLSSAELKVSIDQVLLTYGTDYTVSGIGDIGGGEVDLTLYGGTDPGDIVTIWQDMPIERLTGFTAGAATLLPEALNTELARAARVEQQLRREIRNSLRLAPDDPIGGQDMVLPLSVVRAGMFLAFDADGVPIFSSGVGGADSALRADLASAIATADGSRLIGFRRTETGAVARSSFAKMNDALSPLDFGATFDASTADDAFWANAIAAAELATTGEVGNLLELPRGTSMLGAMLEIPNRVLLRGRNKRGTVLKAAAGHAGPYMISIPTGGVGSGSTFDNRLSELTLNCDDLTGGLVSDSFQEGGGLRDVLIVNHIGYGVRFQSGLGGSALCEISGCEIFGSADGASAGIYADDTISLVAAMMIIVENTTIAGGTVAPSLQPYGIHMDGASLLAKNVHFEVLDSGIYLDGPGNHTIILCNGAGGDSAIETLIEIAATFSGTARIIGCMRNGATNFLIDNRVGGLGTITGRDPPFLLIAP